MNYGFMAAEPQENDHARRTIGLRPEWRNMRIPALRLTELLSH
jgi:hypothetical protein